MRGQSVAQGNKKGVGACHVQRIHDYDPVFIFYCCMLSDVYANIGRNEVDVNRAL